MIIISGLERVAKNVKVFRKFLAEHAGVPLDVFNDMVEEDADVLRLINMYDSGANVITPVRMGLAGRSAYKEMSGIIKE
jgi:hypothetical protein